MVSPRISLRRSQSPPPALATEGKSILKGKGIRADIDSLHREREEVRTEKMQDRELEGRWSAMGWNCTQQIAARAKEQVLIAAEKRV